MPKKNKIIHGNTLYILKTIPSESIDMCIISPPYWALRDYGNETETIWDKRENCKHEWGKYVKNSSNLESRAGHNASVGAQKNPYVWAKQNPKSNFCSKCGAWKGQLGLEPTFDLYIKHLCDIFVEIKRILKKTGTCWVNISDTYGGSGCGTNDYRTKASKSIQGICKNARLYKTGGIAQKINYPNKSLCLIPFRFAIEMAKCGWTIRNVIIWHKPNCIPSSAKDRFTVDFEYLFFFVKNKKYWFDTQYEPYSESFLNDGRWRTGPTDKNIKGDYESHLAQNPKRIHQLYAKPLGMGRNKRCVWTITTKPFTEAHFAVYPEELLTPA